MVSRLPLVRVSGRQRQMPSGDAVPVAAGGTGATSAAAARANLAALSAALPSLRNRLINGAMSINQRTFSGGALAAGAYGYDRWKAGSSAANMSVSSTGVITHSSGPIAQVIEDNNAADLSGSVITVSVEDPSGSVSVSLAYSATSTSAVTGTIAAGPGRQALVLTLPAGTGNLTLTLTASNVTYKRVQLEPGAVATGWDHRHRGIELALAQRYFWQGQPTPNLNFGAHTNGVYFSWPCAHPQVMRAAPTVTQSTSGVTQGGTDLFVFSNADTHSSRLIMRSAAASTNCYFLWGASDYVAFDAEL